MIRLLIIDGLNMVRRIYSALPADDNDTPNIEHFLNACNRAFTQLLEQHQPSHAVCVFEHYATTWRHALYPPYKANRKPQPRAMLASFPALKEKLNAQGISWLDVEGYEADDIIASIAYTTRSVDCQTLIVSTDQLMAQLLDNKTHLYDHFKNQPIDSKAISIRYGVKPEQLSDYFALTGSSSVNIPGISGIGPKSAAKLLTDFKNCEMLVNAPVWPEKFAKKLKGAEHAIYLYRALFMLRKDCPIHGNLKAWRISQPT